ncbi:hypothetical protein C4K68_07790 [Pokkaliibacter plantistimulans]|uniref:Phage abortive infection protein n=1 Tax=Proteobacteria bacterium 228 TaxID=2083153 RepID=A0A2S5KTT7_9PROT|nr:hypothetical protein [Pokkaliibacter plantistimulans]PPC77939.1 hypothetical protein C4K68_07790 [Pokkaliibacter plantistimulans]
MSEQEEAKPQEDKANDHSQEWLIAVAVGLVMLLVIGIYFSKAGLPNASDADLRGELGTLGDFFGGVLNPILSFVSIVLLLITLKQTQKSLGLSERTLEQTKQQLSLSQKEMELTRLEMRETTKAQREVEKTQRSQKFENSFFSLVAAHDVLLQNVYKAYCLEKLLGRIDKVLFNIPNCFSYQSFIESHNEILFLRNYQRIIADLIDGYRDTSGEGKDCDIYYKVLFSKYDSNLTSLMIRLDVLESLSEADLEHEGSSYEPTSVEYMDLICKSYNEKIENKLFINKAVLFSVDCQFGASWYIKSINKFIRKIEGCPDPFGVSDHVAPLKYSKNTKVLSTYFGLKNKKEIYELIHCAIHDSLTIKLGFRISL